MSSELPDSDPPDEAVQPQQERRGVKERRDVKALESILQQEPELYVNLVGEPCVSLPIAKGAERTIYALNHERVRAEIAGFIWDELKLVLYNHELNRILRVLESRAWRDQRVDIELKDAIDRDPLLEGLLIFLADADSKDGVNLKASELLEKLRTKGRLNGVDTDHRSWPKGAAQLSRRIGDLAPLLQQAGITVDRGRNSGGVRFINLYRKVPSDDGEPTASQSPSIDKSHHPTPLSTIDAGDDEIDAIISAISVPPQRSEK